MIPRQNKVHRLGNNRRGGQEQRRWHAGTQMEARLRLRQMLVKVQTKHFNGTTGLHYRPVLVVFSAATTFSI